METRSIGGLTVSALGLGCNNFAARMDYPSSQSVIAAALDHGITLFDTADSYGSGGSEEFLGRALGPNRRPHVTIATKFGKRVGDLPGAATADYVAAACEASLRRLKTDYIDLYQIHIPSTQTPIAETLGALDRLVRAGKVLEIGCSNFSARNVEDAAATNVRGLACAQEEYSILVRDAEREKIPALQKLGMTLLPYFPLANGLLTGKYKGGTAPTTARLSIMADLAKRYLTDNRLSSLAHLTAFAESRGRTILELALGWLAAQPIVPSVIFGASSADQVAQNVKSTGWALTNSELAEINRISLPPA